ncbi:MAG: UvrD-helicase domain-containing protein [Bacteroidales bacterium]|nr:UvrD-helicase domain-containing protein [Bacteroidales bacterium]
MRGKIKLFKASAGSGKTHNLTMEYLRLLFTNDFAYRHILAVTFTNKATEEMKRRIVEELFKRSALDPKSERILINILHDYSSFNISTIDRFFQQTMRAFAREIGKNSSYSVELDSDMVLFQATDQMMQDLGKEENEGLLDWLLNLSYESIEKGENWDTRKGINALAGQLFKEAYKLAKKEAGESLTNRSEIAGYRDMLKTIVSSFEDRLRAYGKEGVSIIKESGLTEEDFSGGAKSWAKKFGKLAAGDTDSPTKTFVEMYDSTEGWISKINLKKNPYLAALVQKAHDNGLRDLIGKIIDFEDERITYKTAQAIYSNIYSLGILADIEKFIRDYSKENGLVLLSETTELLNRIIDGSDTPFIYEKIGSRLDHFMLDEFQDTSVMQWQNFKPLIENSLASGNDNLIVGDVKQSIYRWRGSDWGILGKTIYDDFDNGRIDEKGLNDNWRSCSNIIDFNNEFFPFAAEMCDSIVGANSDMHENRISVKEIYSEVLQNIPENRETKPGYIELKFFPKTGNDEEKWKESALSQIQLKIDALRAKGRKLRDIAILVRTNTEGATVAEDLISKGYKVISGESLFLKSSQSVSTIVSLLRYYNKPDDSINNTIAEFEGITLESNPRIARLPLYEMCEELAGMLGEGVRTSESVYILSFLDLVLDFVKNKRADISSFLDWWDEKGFKASVAAPEGQDAIRIMTIHKSKGLGIKSVIIPFLTCSFKKSSGDIMWCKPLTEPFNAMPLVPVKYSSELAKTIFAPEYEAEYTRNIIDNLNIAYVAFTRAREELIIFAEEYSGKTISSVSNILFEKFAPLLNEENAFVLGELTPEIEEETQFTGEIQIPAFRSADAGERLRLSLKSGDFFEKEKSARTKGIIIHDILSRIYSMEDIVPSVKEAVAAGELSEAEESEVVATLARLIGSVSDRYWFEGKNGVYNELEIIEPGGVVSRPDRVLIDEECVVIDFKTGILRPRSHIYQIESYTALLKQMGYTSVKGYIWYLDENEIMEVI